MTIAEVNKKFFTVPTEWNELSQQQLLDVMECIYMSQYYRDEGRLKLFKIITGLNWWQFFKCRSEELEDLLYLTDFLLGEKTNLTKQLIPHFDFLCGPDSELGNLVMSELVFSDAYFMQWCADKENIQLLNEFCAVLYRPMKKNYDLVKNPDGDPREEFNSNLSNYIAKTKIAKWPMKVKLAIATWYDACRWQIVQENPEVFGGSEADVSRHGLISVIRQVAKGGVLGNFVEVQKKYVSLVMIELNESIADAKEQEQQMKNSNHG